MIVDDLFENVAGPEKCWPGYRKVGTKPGTGRNKGKRVNDCEKIKESAGELGIGDPVIITGDVQFQGKTGDVREFDRDGSFVVVDLYNYGPYSFHVSDVSRNDYADSEDAEDVVEGYDGEELANEVYAEFERMYPNLARRADERTVHAAIMDVLNYGGDNDPAALAQDVARAVKRNMQGVAEEKAGWSIKTDKPSQPTKKGPAPSWRLNPDGTATDMNSDVTYNRDGSKKPGVVEGSLNEFEMPVGQATGVAAQTNNTPKKTYSVKVVGTFKNPTVFMAKDLWRALEEILPRDYPRTPYQQQYATDPQRRVIDDIRDDGFSIVKQGIKSLDIANTIASNFEARNIPAEVIGGLYEDENAQFVPKAGDEILWRPLNAKMVPVPVTVLGLNAEKIKIKLQSPRLIQQYGGKDTIVVGRATSEIIPKPGVTEADTAAERQQALLDRLAARVGLPAGSSMDEIEAAQQAQLNRPQPAVARPQPTDDPDFAAGLAAAQSGQGPLAIMLAQPTIANDQRLLDTIASSYGLPAGLSAQEIQAQSRGALTQTAVSSIARALDLPPGLNRTQLLAAFKQQQGVAEGSLEEIDRRGFLKGLGASALAGAGGYYVGSGGDQTGSSRQTLNRQPSLTPATAHKINGKTVSKAEWDKQFGRTSMHTPNRGTQPHERSQAQIAASQKRVDSMSPEMRKRLNLWADGQPVDEGWKQNLAALGVAGALGLGSVGGAQAATDPVSDKIVATLVIDGETRVFDLSSKNFTDVREASKWLEEFLDARNIENWSGKVERGTQGSGNYQRMRVDSIGSPIREADTDRIADRYDPEEFDDMVLRLKTLAGAGPLKTVWDPVKRVYKNVPINQNKDQK